MPRGGRRADLTCAFGDPADHAALARCVAALEDYDDACFFSLDPGLQTDKLDLQLRKCLLKILGTHFITGRDCRFGCLIFLLLVISHLGMLPDR